MPRQGVCRSARGLYPTEVAEQMRLQIPNYGVYPRPESPSTMGSVPNRGGLAQIRRKSPTMGLSPTNRPQAESSQGSVPNAESPYCTGRFFGSLEGASEAVPAMLRSRGPSGTIWLVERSASEPGTLAGLMASS